MSEERKGWFGSTFNKLKSALSKTKTTLVGDDPEDNSVVEKRSEFQETPTVPSPEPEFEPAPAPVDTPLTETETSETLDATGSGGTFNGANVEEYESKSFEGRPEHVPVSETVQDRKTEAKLQEVDRLVEEAVEEVESLSEEVSASTPVQVEVPSRDEPVQEEQVKEEPVSQTQPQERTFSKALAKESLVSKEVSVDEDYLETLEERLIKADLGLNNAEVVIGHLRNSAKGESWTQAKVVDFLKDEFLKILKAAPSSQLDFKPDKLNIYLVVGVNGTGKTTSIGKLCWRLKKEGKKVLMAAGDTFRAAAESQLEIWSKRADVDIVRLEDGADPGAVVYKALEKARAENYDCLVIDTAGRLHNKANLMAELKKVRGVIDKHASDCNLESLLVIDASTGQNGLQQAKVFTEVCSLTGVVLTKLDGTAKGGIVFSIAKDLDIPVKLIGLGEQIDDLRDFEPEMFVEALL